MWAFRNFIGTWDTSGVTKKIDYSYTEGQKTVMARHEGRLVGTLSVEPSQQHYIMAPSVNEGRGRLFVHEHEPAVIGTAKVHSDYQRQGIGSAMHAVASAQFGEQVGHSDDISPAAVAWAGKMGHDVPTKATNEYPTKVGDKELHGWRHPPTPRIVSSRVADPAERRSGARVSARQSRHQPTQPPLF